MPPQAHKDYDHEALRSEREYGLYWYSALWRVIRPILIGLCALLILFGICFGVYEQINDAFLRPVDENDRTEIAFSVASGSSLSKVSKALEAQNLIRNGTFFKYYCDFAGLGQKIQAGDYLISRNMDLFSVAELLTTGDGNPLVTEITVIPGMTVENIAQMLLEKGILSDTEEFLSICRTASGVEDYVLVSNVLSNKKASQRKYLLEGYLAPDTYEVYTNTSALSIIKKLLSQTDKVLDAEWQSRAEELGFSVDDVLTLASMIEKEAKKQDFPRVSAVFHNRLKAGMMLQSDPTVHYVTGERRMNLRESDLAVSSPYNTYKVKGLPAGPICNPSPNAINAALYPDESYIAEKYLYFCSKDPDSGELHFSRTLEEHNRAVEIYSPLWEAYDAQRGL